MKKGSIRFATLVMGLGLAMPLSVVSLTACGGDTTTYKVTITNKDELTGTWVLSQGGRKINLGVEPEANITDLVNKGEIKFTVSDAEVLQVIGQMAKPLKVGTAKITVEYKGAKDEVDVTILDKLPEPAVVVAKPSEVMAADDTDGKFKYEVSGYIVSWGTKDSINEYGEMRIGDEINTPAADCMYVYGSFAEPGTKAGFTWTGDKYTLAYDRDFLTNDTTKNLTIGDKIKMLVIRADYNTTKEVKGQVVALLEPAPKVPATSVAINVNGKAFEEAELHAKENLLVTAKVEPKNTTDVIEWLSSDETVATVENGFIKTLKAGQATITAKANDTVKAELALTVAEERTPEHAGTEADPYTVDDAVIVTAKMDNKVIGTADIFVKGVVLTSSYSTDYKNYTLWLADSEDNKAYEIYAGVLADDLFTEDELKEVQKTDGLKGYEILVSGRPEFYNNTLEITRYKAEGAEDYTYPLVKSAQKATGTPTKVVLEEEYNVVAGSTVEIKPSFVPFYSSADLTWEIADQTIATVDANGKVTGVAAGETTLTVKVSEEIKATAKIKVAEKDPLTETVALSFTNRTETSGVELKADDSNKDNLGGDTVLEFFQKAGEKGSHVTAVSKSTKVYSGSGTGGAFPGSAGLIKFGSSSVGGELTLVLDGKANKVVINCQSFNDSTSKNNKIAVNGLDAQTAATKTEINSGEDLTFNLTDATDTISLVSSGAYRVLVYSITISYEAPTTLA